MKDSDFLNKLRKEGKLELVEQSEQISESFRKKGRMCLEAAKLVHNAGLYENAVGEAYYSIYNSVQSLFFKCGIKCENHSVAAILLKHLFNLEAIHKTFLKAKKERIDKQYYVTPMQITPVTKESSQKLISIAQNFILDIDDVKNNLKNEQIERIRKDFQKI